MPLKTDKFVQSLQYSNDYRGQMVHVERIPARGGVHSQVRHELHPCVSDMLAGMGIKRLYSHQASAIDAVLDKKNIVVVTGTASGKTLCYNIPVIHELLTEPQAKALYLFPTKALSQDQLRGLARIKAEASLPLLFGTYDGDTPPDMRKRLRDEGDIVLTNPDMLHSGILPHHTAWANFFTGLRYIVIDEIHTYRGTFGSNVANVIRRLKRICAIYGSSPQFICCSATIANPRDLACRLIGEDALLVDNDGSPRGPKTFVLWNPPYIDGNKTERRSSNSEATELMAYLIRSNLQTITFVKARVVAELIYRYVTEELQRLSPSLSNSIRPYRGGYLPEERREVERMLFSGELMGVTTTNALELGINIGSLDACIIVGFPGSIASTWQQAGRAGRAQNEALVFLVAHNLPIDQYLVNNPGYFFTQSPENATINPDNPYIVLGHLRCTVYEAPLSAAELSHFGEYTKALLEILEEDKQVVRRGDKWYWCGTGYPSSDTNLRNMSDNTYTIMDTTTKDRRVMGMTCEPSAFQQLYEQAIYMHEGETYFVEKLDLTEKVAYVHKADVDYFTQSITDNNVRIVNEETSHQTMLGTSGFGELKVTTLTYMFRKIKFYSRDSIGFGAVNLPPLPMDTTGLWLAPKLESLHKVRDFGREASEGLMGIANACTGVVPLFAMCDGMDIGTVVDSSNLGSPTMFIYDKYPGGLGFSQKAYELLEQILEACCSLIHDCRCDDGCPSCVGAPVPPFSNNDPDQGTRGRIPDKEAALILLHDMLGKEPYIPKPVKRKGGGEGPTPEEEALTLQAKRLPENVELRIRKQVQQLKKR